VSQAVATVQSVSAVAAPAVSDVDDSAGAASVSAASAGSGSTTAGSGTDFATTLQQAVVAVDPMSSVTLGQMIADRAGGTTPTAGIGNGGLGQTAAIVRFATGSSGVDSALNVPPVLQAFGNGRIPADMLTPIGIGQHRLWAPAAAAFKQMRADAAAQGIAISVTDTYRTYDQQVQLAAQKGLYKDGGWAAVPGTSPHGWGLATDLDVTPAGLAWVRANGARYGFVETTPREPWHWEYRPKT